MAHPLVSHIQTALTELMQVDAIFTDEGVNSQHAHEHDDSLLRIHHTAHNGHLRLNWSLSLGQESEIIAADIDDFSSPHRDADDDETNDVLTTHASESYMDDADTIVSSSLEMARVTVRLVQMNQCNEIKQTLLHVTHHPEVDVWAIPKHVQLPDDTPRFFEGIEIFEINGVGRCIACKDARVVFEEAARYFLYPPSTDTLSAPLRDLPGLANAQSVVSTTT